MMGVDARDRGISNECRKSYADEPAKCIIPEVAVRFVSTRFFIISSAYDSYQLRSEGGQNTSCVGALGNQLRSQMPCISERPQLNSVRETVLGLLFSLVKQSRGNNSNGFFAYSCTDHCGQLNYKDNWARLQIGGRSLRTAFLHWYLNGEQVAIDDSYGPNENPTCPGRAAIPPPATLPRTPMERLWQAGHGSVIGVAQEQGDGVVPVSVACAAALCALTLAGLATAVACIRLRRPTAFDAYGHETLPAHSSLESFDSAAE